MNFLYIEAGAYELLLGEVEKLTAEIKALKAKLTPSTDDWIDSEEVCFHLDLSPRALQYHRSYGHIPYTYFGKKIFYKRSDIERILAAGLPKI